MQYYPFSFWNAGLLDPQQLAGKNFHDVLDSLLSESELELTLSMVATLKFHASHKFFPSIRSASAQIAMMGGNQINIKTTSAQKNFVTTSDSKRNIFSRGPMTATSFRPLNNPPSQLQVMVSRQGMRSDRSVRLVQLEPRGQALSPKVLVCPFCRSAQY